METYFAWEKFRTCIPCMLMKAVLSVAKALGYFTIFEKFQGDTSLLPGRKNTVLKRLLLLPKITTTFMDEVKSRSTRRTKPRAFV